MQEKPTPTGHIAPKRDVTVKPVAMALQGGGAHGAFTWGVLDYLLEDSRLSIEAVSATSAGAMNAVVMGYGYSIGGAAGARDKLAEFWKSVSEIGRLYSLVHAWPWEKWLQSSGMPRRRLAVLSDFSGDDASVLALSAQSAQSQSVARRAGARLSTSNICAHARSPAGSSCRRPMSAPARSRCSKTPS